MEPANGVARRTLARSGSSCLVFNLPVARGFLHCLGLKIGPGLAAGAALFIVEIFPFQDVGHRIVARRCVGAWLGAPAPFAPGGDLCFWLLQGLRRLAPKIGQADLTWLVAQKLERFEPRFGHFARLVGPVERTPQRRLRTEWLVAAAVVVLRLARSIAPAILRRMVKTLALQPEPRPEPRLGRTARRLGLVEPPRLRPWRLVFRQQPARRLGRFARSRRLWQLRWQPAPMLLGVWWISRSESVETRPSALRDLQFGRVDLGRPPPALGWRRWLRRSSHVPS